MPEELLPIYEIQDFRETSRQKPDFYLNTFEAHLREHAFIQKPHKHNFYILILVTAGSGTHTIDFQQYPVQPGAVFFLSPGQVHAWQLADDTKGHVLFFSREFYLLEHSRKKMQSFPFFDSNLNKPCLNLPSSGIASLLPFISLMEAELSGSLWKKEEVISDLLDILLINLTRLYQDQYARDANAVTVTSVFQQFEALVENHFKEHQPVKFYADQLHFSVKQLNDLIRHTSGKTTTEFLQARSTLEARRLLIHSDLTVTQIAAELGYFDNSYFSRFFKKQTGQTPEQFRQKALLTD